MLARRGALAAALLHALACCLLGGTARAHSPLARELLFAPGAALPVVYLPDFGVAVPGAQSGDYGDYAYACAGLLGLAQLDPRASVAVRHDGALLVGGPGGLHILSPSGCAPALDAGALSTTPLDALAVHPAAGGVVYAAGTGPPATLHRSTDGGEHWTPGATLADGGPVTSLVLSEDDDATLYLTQPRPGGTALLSSDDEGRTLTERLHAGPLQLLALQPGTPPRLWAMAADDAAREVGILVAQLPQATFTEVHRVRFFGGLAIGDQGASVWVGDEAGGLHRSRDGGQTFTDLDPKRAVACLHHYRGELWACIPGASSEPAVSVSDDGGDSWHNVLALDEVDGLVTCPQQDVAALCMDEWDDWRFGGPLASPPSTETDAGLGQAAAAGDRAKAAGGGGCSIAGPAPGRDPHTASGSWVLCTLAACWVMRRRARRQPRRTRAAPEPEVAHAPVVRP